MGVALTLLVASLSYAQTFTVLHEFAGFPNDGRMPTAPLIEDSAGNLYGTAYAAGKFGGGIVFKLNPNGHETVLHNFSSGSYGARGANAYGLVRDAAGNLYGTTFEGGDLSCNPGHGCGTVFKLDTSNRLTVLHAFHWTDGSGPNSGLILAADGTLYGTTAGGGNGPTGTVFTVDTVTGHLTLLKSFPSSFGGPTGSIAIDAAGNLYGATYFGGGPSCTCGTVFELEAGAGFTVMWEGKDGMTPLGGVTLGSDGNLYFTTSGFGDACSHTCGAVFRLNPATYQATMLYSFTGLADGAYPAAGLALDSEGTLYGTTAFGGKTTTP
ncbi:MAG: choice-of-anchor tandem repeat GloVer-containing protein, partial [Thermoplasmata archaeon]